MHAPAPRPAFEHVRVVEEAVLRIAHGLGMDWAVSRAREAGTAEDWQRGREVDLDGPTQACPHGPPF